MRIRLSGSLLRDLYKYGFVAVFALIADAGSLFLLHSQGVNYLVAATLGFLIGTIVNFLLSDGFVFKNPVVKNRGINFTLYALIGLVSLVFNDVIIWALHSQLDTSVAAAKLVSVAVVFFWNFLARRQFLYRGHKVEIGKEISFEG